MDFSIKFHFDKSNPYFTNVVLEKTFEMRDEETPIRSKATVIDWKEDKNLTKKQVQRVSLKFLFYGFKNIFYRNKRTRRLDTQSSCYDQWMMIVSSYFLKTFPQRKTLAMLKQKQ